MFVMLTFESIEEVILLPLYLNLMIFPSWNQNSNWNCREFQKCLVLGFEVKILDKRGSCIEEVIRVETIDVLEIDQPHTSVLR